MRLTTNQKVAGLSPARIDNLFSWRFGRGQRNSIKVIASYRLRRSCGAMDNASDYESEDCRFESCQDRYSFLSSLEGDRNVPVSEGLGASVWLRIRGLLGSIFYTRIARIPGWAMLCMLPKNRMVVHRIKRLASFPSPAGMSLPNSPWAGIMTS